MLCMSAEALEVRMQEIMLSTVVVPQLLLVL